MDWTTILTDKQLAECWADMAKLDPRYERSARTFWEGCSEGKLHGERRGAWNSNERETFVITSSYLALLNK